MKRPLQKRLVGRQWLVFVPGLLLFLLLCGVFADLWAVAVLE